MTALSKVMNSKKIEQILSYFCVFGIFILVLINDTVDYDPLLVFMFVFAIYLSIFREFRIRIPKVMRFFWYAILFYYGFLLFHILIDWYFYGFDEKNFSQLSRILGLWVFIGLLHKVDFSNKDFRNLLLTMATVCILVWVIEFVIYFFILQSWGSGVRLGYIIAEVGEYGWFVGVLVLPLCLLGLLYDRSVNRLFLYIIVLLTMEGMILAGTRGYWIAFFMTGGVLLLLLFKTKVVSNKLVFIVLGSVLFFMVLSYMIFTDFVLSRILNIIQSIPHVLDGNYQSNVGVRLTMLHATLDGIKDHFWWGIGDVNFAEYLARVANLKGYSHVHNQLAMDFLTRGILGFLSSLLVTVYPIWYFFKRVRQATSKQELFLPLVGFSFALSSFIYFQVGAVLYYSHGVIYYFYFLATIFYLMDKSDQEKSNNSQGE